MLDIINYAMFGHFTFCMPKIAGGTEGVLCFTDLYVFPFILYQGVFGFGS